MQAIDLTQIFQIEQNQQHTVQKLKKLTNRTFEISGRIYALTERTDYNRTLKKCIQDMEEEIHVLRQMSDALQEVSSIYRSIEDTNLTYLEEVRIAENNKMFVEWCMPEWVVQLLKEVENGSKLY